MVCPTCAYPAEEDHLIQAEWETTCSLCGWRGESSELIEYTDHGKYVNPKVFEELMSFLHKEVSPAVGQKMVQLGIVSTDSSRDHIIFFSKLLRDYSRAGFEAVLKGVLTTHAEEKN